MYTEVKKDLIYKDFLNVYSRCKNVCNEVLKSNSKCENSFILYKYIHFGSLFDLVENHKFSTVNVIYPSSRILTVGKGYEYLALWIEKETILNIVADFASIYIVSEDNKIEILFTLPIWALLLKKIIRLFHGVKVTYVYF